jgi:hypothetical protein
VFFLLFGLRTRESVVSRRPMVCEVCGVNAVQTLVKRSTKFTLFFIPLFPVKPSTYYMDCGNCGSARRTDRRAADYLAA